MDESAIADRHRRRHSKIVRPVCSEGPGLPVDNKQAEGGDIEFGQGAVGRELLRHKNRQGASDSAAGDAVVRALGENIT